MKNRLHSFICRGVLPLMLCFVFFTKTYSQHFIFGNETTRAEVGLNFGPTFFLGDLGGHHGYGTTFIKDLNLPLTKLMKGAFISVYPNEWYGVRVAGQLTYLEGRDNIIGTSGENELYRKQRNLDFKTDVWELYGAVEFFPTMYFKRNDEDYLPALRPYIFAGVGVFHFNPKGSITDRYGNKTWHELQPLHTEGQGFAEYPQRREYSLTQMNIPFGAGIKYYASDRVNLGLELLYRKTFTDYIDDVSTEYIDPNHFDKYLSPEDAVVARQISDKVQGIVNPGLTRNQPGIQRGNPNNKDSYFSFALKLGIQIGGGDRTGGDHYTGTSRSTYRSARRSLRCPARF